MSLRLPVGEVTTLLGPALARRRILAGLDDDSARCPRGQGALVVRVRGRAADTLLSRHQALDEARQAGAAIVLVDRLTDGLSAAERREVLGRLHGVAASGAAVLVDDADPVAALAVADGTLRADPARGLVLEPVELDDYLAS